MHEVHCLQGETSVSFARVVREMKLALDASLNLRTAGYRQFSPSEQELPEDEPTNQDTQVRDFLR
jgi:hypothetical protein